jgi:AcrR family transcriptional regulator
MQLTKLRLFAAHGYAGVTLRGLAGELGQSPTAAYRYFDCKADIFTAARVRASERFARVQEEVSRGSGQPLERLSRLGTAYIQFAIDEPDAYRLIFELKPPDTVRSAELKAASERAFAPLRETIGCVVDAGVLHGDAHELAHLFWAGLHGLASLHLAGKLDHGRSLEQLRDPMKRLLFLGSREQEFGR